MERWVRRLVASPLVTAVWRRYWTAVLLLPAGLALLLLPPLACHATAARLVCGFLAVAG